MNNPFADECLLDSNEDIFDKKANRYQLAFKKWREILGENHIDLSYQTKKKYSKTTFESNNHIIGVIHPSTKTEVQHCLKVANDFKIPVHVVSTGKNWGNGSAVPHQQDCLLMHLGRMNKISNLNKKQAYVSIEPGVTQFQLAEYLESSGSDLWMDVTGASGHCSIVGNIMERGVGHSEYGNRVSYICHLEVVLANGDIINTGFGKYENAKAKDIYQWGVGPSLDGLFSESNFGIVTKLTMWLIPKPENVEGFYFSAKNENDLKEIVDLLQPLRLKGILKSSIHIGNNYKVLNSRGQYPWHLAKNTTPLSENILEKLSQEIGCESWNGSGALYGTNNQIKETKRLLKKAFKGTKHKLNFLSEKRLNLIKKFPKILSFFLNIDFKSLLPIMDSIFGMQKGIPTDDAMTSAYWRKKSPAPNKNADPDQDNCGLIWYSPVAPIDGDHATEIYKIAKKILTEFQFDPIIAFAFISERALCSVIAILYDRDDPLEDTRAMQCHLRLIKELNKSGYYPYRLGTQNMKKLPTPEASYRDLMAKLKKSFDPNNIISPGRYEL